jgi:hypothetical protein
MRSVSLALTVRLFEGPLPGRLYGRGPDFAGSRLQKFQTPT